MFFTWKYRDDTTMAEVVRKGLVAKFLVPSMLWRGSQVQNICLSPAHSERQVNGSRWPLYHANILGVTISTTFQWNDHLKLQNYWTTLHNSYPLPRATSSN